MLSLIYNIAEPVEPSSELPTELLYKSASILLIPPIVPNFGEENKMPEEREAWMTVGFDSLPAELRNMCYEYTIIENNKKDLPLRSGLVARSSHTINPSILLLDKRIHDEYKELVHRTVSFLFIVPLNPFPISPMVMEREFQPFSRYMRRVEIHIMVELDCWARKFIGQRQKILSLIWQLIKQLDRMPCLRQVKILISARVWNARSADQLSLDSHGFNMELGSMRHTLENVQNYSFKERLWFDNPVVAWYHAKQIMEVRRPSGEMSQLKHQGNR